MASRNNIIFSRGGVPMSSAEFAARLDTNKVVQQDPVTEVLQVAGVDIPPAIPIAWADFILLDWTQLGGLFYLVTDVHSVGTTGGSLWMADATGNSPVLKDRQVQCATFALAVSTYPPATYPGLVIHVADFDIDIISNGTRYVPVNKRAQIFLKVFGTLAAPTAAISSGTTYSFNTLLGTPTFPADMFDTGDVLDIETNGRRDGANATMAHKVSLGTAGTNSDASVWSGTLAATDALCFNTRSKVIFGSDAAFITNSSASFSGTGGTGQLAAGTTNVAVGSPLILSVNGTKNASDTINIFTVSAEWITQ